MASPRPGWRGIAAPRHPETEAPASRMGERRGPAGIGMALVDEEGGEGAGGALMGQDQ